MFFSAGIRVSEFKSKAYQVAIDTHKFYDETSIKILSGAVAITGASFVLAEKMIGTSFIKGVFFLTVGLIVMFMIPLYRHSSKYADIARSVAASIEKGGDVFLATVYKDKKLANQYFGGKPFGYNMHTFITLILITCFLGLLATSFHFFMVRS